MTPAENVPVALPLRQLSLEITGKCNLTCSRCARSEPRLSLQGEMATADWLRLIDEGGRAPAAGTSASSVASPPCTPTCRR